MIPENERKLVKNKLDIIFDKEKEKLGLKDITYEIDFENVYDQGYTDFDNKHIVISLGRVSSYERGVSSGYYSLRHELRHFWQYINKPVHAEWWIKHKDYYNKLYEDGRENDCCSVEIDAEAYAKGDSSKVYLLDEPIEMLEEKMKNYYAR